MKAIKPKIDSPGSSPLSFPLMSGGPPDNGGNGKVKLGSGEAPRPGNLPEMFYKKKRDEESQENILSSEKELNVKPMEIIYTEEDPDLVASLQPLEAEGDKTVTRSADCTESSIARSAQEFQELIQPPKEKKCTIAVEPGGVTDVKLMGMAGGAPLEFAVIVVIGVVCFPVLFLFKGFIKKLKSAIGL